MTSLEDAAAWREAVPGRRIRSDGAAAHAAGDTEAPKSMSTQLLAERLRRERGEADKVTLAVAELRGDLVRVDRMKRAHTRAVVAARTRLMDLGPRLAPQIAGMGDITSIQVAIDLEVKAAMREAAEVAAELLDEDNEDIIDT
ncbi:MAG: hypothetical protein KJZ81_07840 [Burkholderiaceae bacterium]|nr:hypothetical protein [Burkholderiaceae bacterium]